MSKLTSCFFTTGPNKLKLIRTMGCGDLRMLDSYCTYVNEMRILFYPVSKGTSFNRLCISSVQFSPVAQSCPTLYDPMNHSMPGLSVHHQLPKITQTHAHRIGDAIQPSHPLSSPSHLAPIPPSIRVFSNESTLRMRWPNYWNFSYSISPSNEHPGLISFRMDWLDLLAVQGTLKSLLQHHSSKINFSALNFLHSPTLTSIHDHWKNHSLD